LKQSTEKLLDISSRFPGKKIAVWGDFILDEYIYGNTRRISREAPVLILSYKNSSYALGGAGNALLNLKSLGAEPIPVGITGKDAAGRQIRDMLAKEGISTDHLMTRPRFKTPLKTRILAGEAGTRKQQILRIDRESQVPGNREIESWIQSALESLKPAVRALLVSDYHYFTVRKSIFQSVLPSYSGSGIPVTLDSRFRILDFKGVTIATPNETEVGNALNIDVEDGEQAVQKAGETLLKRSKAQAFLITRGSRGMMLFEREKPIYSIPVYGTQDIVDVAGAGDTVISVLTLALACGADFKQATALANYAGGIVVMKKGTASLDLSELQTAVKKQS